MASTMVPASPILDHRGVPLDGGMAVRFRLATAATRLRGDASHCLLPLGLCVPLDGRIECASVAVWLLQLHGCAVTGCTISFLLQRLVGDLTLYMQTHHSALHPPLSCGTLDS